MDNGDQKPTSSTATLSPPPSPTLSSGIPSPASPPVPRPAADYCLTVAIPVFNERDTVLPLLEKVRALTDIPKDILLVDDGSSDGTRELLKNEVENRYSDVRIFYHEQNQGKGAAILTAIRHAVGDFLIVQDADLEYDPEEYRVLLPPLVDGKTDVVYGSRFRGEVRDMRPANLLANRILTIAANILFPGARLTDEATCYKMFRLPVLRGLPLRARRFDFCPEVTAKLLKRGHRIVEIPIHYRARTTAQGKKIHWTDGFHALWTLIKYRFID